MENGKATGEETVHSFQVIGITCLDCAQKFEQAVSELPGIVKASLNTMTGKLTVEGDANFKAIQELGKDEDYTVAIVTQPSGLQTAVFQVEGITCLDCAQKFEKAVGGMPGVTKATLNTMTSKLTVEGRVDLAGIQRLGLEENYTIRPETVQSAQAGQQSLEQADWELRRAILSGLALVVGYGLEKFGVSAAAYIPIYVAAVVLGGVEQLPQSSQSIAAWKLQHERLNECGCGWSNGHRTI